jgi:hypothetical protein
MFAQAQPMWASHAVHSINTEVGVVGYEAYVMVNQKNGAHELSGRLGFSKRDSEKIANWYAHVNFLDDGNISIAYPSVSPPGHVLQSYVTDTWYKVKVILDREDDSYSVWIDDVLRAENISFPYVNSYEHNNFALSATMEGNSKVYFDDVKFFSVFEVNPKLDLQPTSGIAQTTLVGTGFRPNSIITVTWNGTTVYTLPNPLFVDGFGNFTAIISVLNQTTTSQFSIKAIDELGNEALATFAVIPEFPSWIILPLFLVVTLFGVIIKKKFRGL